MATDRIFVQVFRDCVACDPLVAIAVTPGSARRRAQRRCSVLTRLHRFGAPPRTPLHELRARSPRAWKRQSRV